ncbi:MAG: Ig-like domain-containing protein, partial [Gammaproteobacteria bacterium]
MLTVNAVNDAPVAVPIADFSLLEDDANVVLNLNATFVDADVFTDNDSLVVSLVSNSNQALFDDVRVFSLFGWRLELDLAANRSGVADMTLRAVDRQGASVEESFRVTVLPVNDLPVLVASFDDVMVDEDAANVTVDLREHFDDVDIATSNDALAYTIGNTNAAMFDGVSVGGDLLTLDFGADRNGIATFTIAATDSAGATVEDAFVVTVNPVNDAPFVAQAIADLTLNEDDPNYPVSLVPVFDDVDFDNEGDAFTYGLVGNFDPVLFDDVSVDMSTGVAVLILDLAEHQFGSDTLTVRATDKEGISIDDTFQVVVNPQNDVPVAVDDAYSMEEDTGPLVMNVLANDFLEDAPVTLVDAGMTIVIEGRIFTNATESVPTTQPDALGDPVTLPNGTVFVENGVTISYQPKENFSGTDFFTYLIRDVDGEQSTGTVTVAVSALNDAPYGFGAMEYTLEENRFLSVLPPGLLLNATDPDGDVVSVVLQETTSDGELVINPDGSFTYTPDVGFTGTDGFSYYLSDGATTSVDMYVVTLRVTPAPPPPEPPPEGEVEFDFQLADLPLELAVGTEPNVLVLMDDSGSMDWTLSTPYEREGRFLISTQGLSGVNRQASTIFAYVHDLPTNTYGNRNSIGRIVPSEEALDADNAFDGNPYGVWRARTHKYNKLYYNPEVQYLPWRGLGPDNKPFDDIDYKHALLDPMDKSRTIDLRDDVSFTSYRVPRMRGRSATKDVHVEDFYIPRYYATPESGPDLAWNDPHVLVEIRDDGSTYQGGPARSD